MTNTKPNNIIWFDGAARGNPGLAGAGAVFQSTTGRKFTNKMFLKITTNNMAEYNGLKLGLNLAFNYFKENNENRIGNLIVYGDSELIIKQLKGEYRVRNENLKILYDEVQELLKQIRDLFPTIKIIYEHIPRNKNDEADGLANKAIDSRS